jgi:hypothetical protein
MLLDHRSNGPQLLQQQLLQLFQLLPCPAADLLSLGCLGGTVG